MKLSSMKLLLLLSRIVLYQQYHTLNLKPRTTHIKHIQTHVTTYDHRPRAGSCYAWSMGAFETLTLSSGKYPYIHKCIHTSILLFTPFHTYITHDFIRACKVPKLIYKFHIKSHVPRKPSYILNASANEMPRNSQE